MSGKKPTDDNSREEMELTDLTSVSCKLTDENKERLAKEKNKDIQLGGVVEEPCTFSEERSLEDGSHITPVDITQEHPVINTANEEAHALEVERKLDEALREGDFDLLQERITPKTLTSCKTNALFKTFEVSWAFLQTYTINCCPLSSPVNLNFKIIPEWRSC
ncbi:unnamed protein product [Porites lobata]|uniref:Uncharacterized protein n=1 Tax=Porites lobata TaxID=104759 RepID=A0ABN8MVH6_9CNID|nr:unnamed protein product [Porites lobata]